jgi:hypothetical protein
VDYRLKIVTELPLKKIWTPDGPIDATRGRDLDSKSIEEVLQRGEVQFIVANVGFRLEWVPAAAAKSFWRREVQPHLVESASFSLEDFPNSYAYLASRWEFDRSEIPMIVLEKHH